MDAEKGEERQEDDRRGDHLHHAYAQIAKAAVDSQRAALFRFGEKKLIFPMLEAKFAPAKPHSSAIIINTQNGVVIFWIATPTKYKARSG